MSRGKKRRVHRMQMRRIGRMRAWFQMVSEQLGVVVTSLQEMKEELEKLKESKKHPLFVVDTTRGSKLRELGEQEAERTSRDLKEMGIMPPGKVIPGSTLERGGVEIPLTKWRTREDEAKQEHRMKVYKELRTRLDRVPTYEEIVQAMKENPLKDPPDPVPDPPAAPTPKETTSTSSSTETGGSSPSPSPPKETNDPASES